MYSSSLLILVSLFASASAQEVCKNWAVRKAAFDAAKAAFVEPECYRFKYEDVTTSGSGPIKSVFVVRGSPTGEGDKTLGDFFDMIDTMCFSGCPTEGAYECTNTYAAIGYPLSIFIDISMFSAGEEERFKISGFAEEECPPETKAPTPAPTKSPTSAPVVGANDVVPTDRGADVIGGVEGGSSSPALR